MTRILITGFGPFPGAPSNPTSAIVRHLTGSRKLRFRGVEKLGQVLPTHWNMLGDFRQTIRNVKPDAVLMFGLAGRRRAVTPEARAINRASLLRCDADGKKPEMLQLARSAPAFRRSTIDARRIVTELRQSGLAARVSQDAGDYLCNGLLWTALETGVPAIFVHVPMPLRAKRPKASQKHKRLSKQDLARAGETALAVVLKMVTVKQG